jgi:hypothetical protein
MGREMEREPSIGGALERTFEAGQSLVVRRIDLLVAESKVLAQSGAMVVLGAVVGLIGWIYLVNGAIEGLASRYPRFAVVLAAGVLHLAIAGVLVLRARSRTDV